MISNSFRRCAGACCVVLAGLGAAACSSDSTSTEAPVAQTVTIIGTDSAQNKILSDIYAGALEQGGFRVARRASVADDAAGYAALKSGAAQLFVTHTAELLTYLATTEPAAASTSTTQAATTSTTSVVSVTSTTSTAGGAVTSTTGPGDGTGTGTTTAAAADSTTTTVPTAGQASAISLNLQSNLIGEILPEGLQIGAASNAEDKAVVACNSTTATGITLLSDLAAISDRLRIAAPADFETGDPFGLVGFTRTYGAGFAEVVPVAAEAVGEAFAPTTTIDATSTTAETTTTAVGAVVTPTVTTVAAAVDTDADCGAFASSLDPAITSEMVVLDDDKNWVENNGVLPLLTAAAATPVVLQAVDQVSQSLTTADLREMIRAVGTGASASEVAASWLQTSGLAGS